MIHIFSAYNRRKRWGAMLPPMALVLCCTCLQSCTDSSQSIADAKTALEGTQSKPQDAETPVVHLFPVEAKEKWGYIDRAGNWVIQPQFDGAGEFTDGFAIVYSNDTFSFIDVAGSMVIPFTPIKFDYITEFSEGLAAIAVGDKWGYMNQRGEIVIEPQFYQFDGIEEIDMRFSEGIATVLFYDGEFGPDPYSEDFDGHYAFIDKSGQIVLPQHSGGGLFKEGLATVSTDSGMGYINREGEFVIMPQFDWAWPFSDGLALVRLRDSEDASFAYINKAGNFAFDGRFAAAEPFSDGLAAVRLAHSTSDKYGFIDTKGNLVIPEEFEIVFMGPGFSEGRMLVVIDNRYGFIDKTGKIVIEPQFDSAEGFRNGLARVTFYRDAPGQAIPDSDYAYVDKSGNIIRPKQ